MKKKSIMEKVMLAVAGLLRNWFFQRFSSIDRGMAAIKWGAEAVVVLALVYAGRSYGGLNSLLFTVVAIIVVHTVFWVLFCSVWYPLMCSGELVGNDVQYVYSYAEVLQRRLRRPFVRCMAVSGSVAKGTASPYSDIDILIVRQPGFTSAWRAVALLIEETMRAHAARIPLELLWSSSPKLIGNAGKRIVFHDPERLFADVADLRNG